MEQDKQKKKKKKLVLPPPSWVEGPQLTPEILKRIDAKKTARDTSPKDLARAETKDPGDHRTQTRIDWRKTPLS
jgi:hypothetical protein